MRSSVSSDLLANLPTNVTSLLHSQSSTLQVAVGVVPQVGATPAGVGVGVSGWASAV